MSDLTNSEFVAVQKSVFRMNKVQLRELGHTLNEAYRLIERRLKLEFTSNQEVFFNRRRSGEQLRGRITQLNRNSISVEVTHRRWPSDRKWETVSVPQRWKVSPSLLRDLKEARRETKT